MKRLSWDQYFMAQANLVALRSTCARLNVGAVIVRENRIIASGYNGSVHDGDHCIDKGCYIVDGHCVRTVHAEANALLQCAKFGVATNDTEIYVTFHVSTVVNKLFKLESKKFIMNTIIVTTNWRFNCSKRQMLK